MKRDSSAVRAPRPAAKTSLQLLDRTFAILDLFNEETPEWSTTELARAVDVPIPTVYRVLSALRDHRYLSQDSYSKRFRLGPATLQLGNRARAVVDLRSAALPTLRHLSRETGETALLTVVTPQNDRSLCLERVETSQSLRLSVAPGRELPLHAGASQKALAAFMEPEALEHVLSRPLDPLCDNTITDPELLRTDLERIRSAGWASSVEETNRGAWGIAIPVLDDRGVVVCAIGIAGPLVRLAHDRIGELVTQVHTGARDVADALGYQVPTVETTPSRMVNPKKSRRRR